VAHKLVDAAASLRALAFVPEEVARAVVPIINEQIRKLGKPGGPLRSGNAVKAYVVAQGRQIKIIGVFPQAGVRRSWITAIHKIVAEAIAAKMRG